ncbi:MAG TPA: hypothetical protein VGC96_14825, partial [Candidatus Elarobacter sp.]
MTTRAWRLLTGAVFSLGLLASQQPFQASAATAAPKPAAADPRAWPATYEETAMTPAELLASAKAASGSPEARKQPMRLAFETHDGGLSGTRRELWSGDDYRMDTVEGPFVSAWGRRGGQRWETNENGYTLLTRGIHKRGQANARAIEKPENNEAVKVLGRLRAPADVYVLRVAPPDRREERRFYDASSKRLVRREIVALERLLVETFEDYRTVAGVTMPFKTTVSDGRPENDASETLTDARVGEPVAAEDLEIPGSRRLPVSLPGGVPSVRLPARITGSGTVIVRLTVKGRGLDFQLDSGAGGILINRDVA